MSIEPSSVQARPGRGWQEVYLRGGAQEEARLFADFAREINEIQRTLRARRGAGGVGRAFHVKAVAAFDDASFVVPAGVPGDLAVGLFAQPGEHQAVVRFSNASGIERSDIEPDLRGVAVRVLSDAPGGIQDFLMTNAPASHARDAAQFMVAARAAAKRSRLGGLFLLLRSLGVRETLRIVRTVKRDARAVSSLATEAFWSRSAFAFGDVAVRLKLSPEAADSPMSTPGPSPQNDNLLREDLARRLASGPVVFALQVQRYVDESATPIEDGAADWPEAVSPPETIARLVIPPQRLDAQSHQPRELAIEGLEFSPWNTSPQIRPLGSLNRARRAVYVASASLRRGAMPASE